LGRLSARKSRLAAPCLRKSATNPSISFRFLRRPPPPTAEPQAAFISYSREDSEFALRLAEDLKAAGAAAWIDQLDIAPGQRWAQAVQNALNDCPLMLMVWI